YVQAMFAEMWEREKKLDDPAVMEAALKDAGLDSALLLSRIQDPEVKQALLANTQAVFERGAFGSPTFFVNDEIYFGKDKLVEVEEEIMRVKAA
nr:DsbA family protein [Pseudomonas sp.]